MLESLKVKNFALIDNVELEFYKGLNIITGETGAGKSILVKALNLLLGERSDKDVIRQGEKEAQLEAVFQVDSSRLVEWGLSEDLANLVKENDGQLILKRTISNEKSKILLNDSPITLQMLKSITRNLISIANQHEYHNLLSTKNQLEFLDVFGQVDEPKKQYTTEYKKLTEISKRLLELETKNKEKETKADYIEYQLSQIKTVGIDKIRKEAEMIEEKQSILNTKKLQEKAKLLRHVVNGPDGLIMSLREVIAELKDFPELGNGEAFELALDASQDLLKKIKVPSAESTASLEDLEAVLNEISKIKRKLGGSVEAVLAQHEKLSKELKDYKEIDKLLAQSKKDKIAQEEICMGLAKKLSALRKQSSISLSSAIEKEIRDLNMKSAKINLEVVESTTLSFSGINEINFLIAPNKGEDFRLLQEIASGGELSRIMLAIQKTLTTKKSSEQAYVFDEIDSGIGGQTAQTVGEKLKEIGSRGQVISITHLPQVAAFAQNHLYIFKEEKAGRTFTKVKNLSPEERISEISRLLGGTMAQKQSRDHAEQMIKEAQK